ncbi:transposase [Streptomyces sp. NPDC057460]|uniref:transposase n=1 Tax=Streptomyces sp. NPDC057460 TaxID=3346141 RepID=UPI0036C36E1A
MSSPSQLGSQGQSSATPCVGVGPRPRHQRCWVHKTAYVLDAPPKSAQRAAKRATQEICDAEDKEHEAKGVATFAKQYGAKCPKIVKRITDDEDRAERWIHLRTMNQPSRLPSQSVGSDSLTGRRPRSPSNAVMDRLNRIAPGQGWVKAVWRRSARRVAQEPSGSRSGS